jgi:hypothetical protein
MSDFAQKPATGEAPASANAPAGKPATNAPAFVGIAGTLIVLAVAGLVAMKSDLFTEAGSASAPIVSLVDQRDIDAASSTLNPSVAGGLVDEAKRCKIPLASITIARGTAQLGSTLRIRAGNYVSPYFSITDNMQRIALPYPAPYGAGAGNYVVEGNATGAILGLAPTKVLSDLPTPQTIPVVWRATNPC